MDKSEGYLSKIDYSANNVVFFIFLYKQELKLKNNQL